MDGDSFNPDVLIAARESRNETQTSVAAAVGVRQGFISKVENRLQGMSPEQVERVAAFLKYPPALFYEPGPILEGKSGCLFHSKRKTLPAKVLNTVDGQMAMRLINARHMLQGLQLDVERTFHRLDPDTYGSPENVARALRTAWGVPDGPIHDLVALIESAGGIIVMSSFGHHKLFGMSQWTTRDHPLFFLNADMAMEDLRWTIAHELGHLIMHNTPTSDDPEEEADEFAGEFLAPRQLIVPEVRRLKFTQLPALKMRWRIAMKAIIRRAEKTEAITRPEATRLYKQYSARRWHNAEPFPLPVENPTLIVEAAQVHLREHDYTMSQLAEAVRLYEDEMKRELFGERGGQGGLSLVPN